MFRQKRYLYLELCSLRKYIPSVSAKKKNFEDTETIYFYRILPPIMAFNRNNIRTVEDCYMGDPMDQASVGTRRPVLPPTHIHSLKACVGLS